MRSFRRASNWNDVVNAGRKTNQIIIPVGVPPLSLKSLERLVEEGFILSVEEGISDAIRRYLAYARREIKSRERFRDRKKVVSLDGYTLKSYLDGKEEEP